MAIEVYVGAATAVLTGAVPTAAPLPGAAGVAGACGAGGA
jgi:hypothetical protein